MLSPRRKLLKLSKRFRGDKRKGTNYRSYASFVEFLFGVGCRPSEAIGLQWKHISQDCGLLSFEGSLVQIGNRRVRCYGSKNNRTREFAVSNRIQTLLLTVRPECPDPDQLVFPSPDGDAINYRNFSRRAWSSVVDPIKDGITPYSCQDTALLI